MMNDIVYMAKWQLELRLTESELSEVFLSHITKKQGQWSCSKGIEKQRESVPVQPVSGAEATVVCWYTNDWLPSHWGRQPMQVLPFLHTKQYPQWPEWLHLQQDMSGINSWNPHHLNNWWVNALMHLSLMPHPPRFVVGGDYEGSLTPTACPFGGAFALYGELLCTFALCVVLIWWKILPL